MQSDLQFTSGNTISPIPRRLGLRLVGPLAAAAALIALNLALPAPSLLIAEQTAVFLVVFAVMLFGLFRAVRRDGQRRSLWLLIAAPAAIWLAVIWWLAVGGAFRGTASLPLAIFLPLIIGLPLLLRWERLGRVLDATPPSWLVGIQVYRIFGGVFLAAWLSGTLPGAFGVPAGAGDVLVGILALPVAALLQAGTPGARTAAIAWNVLGILDLADAVTLGFFSTPGPLQLIKSELIGPSPLLAYPLVMIPAFAVPVSLLLHALSLRQLRRIKER